MVAGWWWMKFSPASCLETLLKFQPSYIKRMKEREIKINSDWIGLFGFVPLFILSDTSSTPKEFLYLLL